MIQKLVLIVIINLIITVSLFSQIVVDINTYTPTQLVQDKLFSGCSTASNISFQGDAMQIGYFTATGPGATALGFPLNNSGIILSSGDTRDASGPNTSGSTSTTCPPNIHDPQLATITSPTAVNDCAVLEFDFIPQSDTIEFRYIFASEEYPEFVNSTYNDAFGFFITGPNPNGGNYLNQNIALIPGTIAPVTINNVNNGTSTPTSGPCVNCNYYIDNSTGNWHIEYDGYTTVLTATIIVNMYQTYHIKIAVGDAGDRAFDSAILIEEVWLWGTSSTEIQAPSIYACDSAIINGNWYYSNQTVIDTIIGSCDTIVITNLTIVEIDTTVTLYNSYITSNEIGAAYQWIDCDSGNSIIAGETNQLFYPTVSGNYAVIITKNGCVDTSACVPITIVSIENLNYEFDLTIYPNPTNGNSILECNCINSNTSISIINVIGQEVYLNKNVDNNRVHLNTSILNKGVYFVKVNTENRQKIIKLIKQ